MTPGKARKICDKIDIKLEKLREKLSRIESKIEELDDDRDDLEVYIAGAERSLVVTPNLPMCRCSAIFDTVEDLEEYKLCTNKKLKEETMRSTV